MLLNVMNIIQDYTQTTNGSSKEAFDFILKHRHDVSKQLLKEMMLNYRTYFKTDQKERIVNDYKQFVISKPKEHTSDIAIGYNIIKYVKVNETAEKEIINYLYNRLSQHIDSRLAGVYFLRRKSVLEYVEQNILIKRRT
jgi:hypothetical protein